MGHVLVELPDDLLERLTSLAAGAQSTPAALLARAARHIIEQEEEMARVIERGEADIAAGRVVPHEEVMADLEAWAAGIRARQRG